LLVTKNRNASIISPPLSFPFCLQVYKLCDGDIPVGVFIDCLVFRPFSRLKLPHSLGNAENLSRSFSTLLLGKSPASDSIALLSHFQVFHIPIVP
jgi:hypothetical protein